MKYRKLIIVEDNGLDIRSIKNINEFSRKSGIDRGYLSKILSNKTIASENIYLKIKNNYENKKI